MKGCLRTTSFRTQFFSFFFFSPARSQDANWSFQIELKTLDIRSNSAHEDEWAANCGLSRMSRGSSPAIFHSRSCTVHYKSISLALPLLLSLSLFVFYPSVCTSCTAALALSPSPLLPYNTRYLGYIGALAPADGVTNANARGRIHHASHFVTAGSTALKLYSRFENSP